MQNEYKPNLREIVHEITKNAPHSIRKSGYNMFLGFVNGLQLPFALSTLSRRRYIQKELEHDLTSKIIEEGGYDYGEIDDKYGEITERASEILYKEGKPYSSTLSWIVGELVGFVSTGGAIGHLMYQYDYKIFLIPIATNLVSWIHEKTIKAKESLIEKKKAIKKLEEEINDP